MKRLALLVVVLVPSALGADEVYLRGGGQLSGIVLERTATTVLIEVGPGQIRLPLSRVERIATGSSALAQYRARVAALASEDVGGWIQLARWAEARGLLTQAREAYEHVLHLDPHNAAAHQGVGHVALDGRWVSEEESYRARGLVLFEGSWMSPEERRALLEERAVAIHQERARAEADARAREAEARARAAEAEARRAEAALRAESEPAGIPFGLMGPVYGPTVIGGYGYGYGGYFPPIHPGVLVRIWPGGHHGRHHDPTWTHTRGIHIPPKLKN